MTSCNDTLFLATLPSRAKSLRSTPHPQHAGPSRAPSTTSEIKAADASFKIPGPTQDAARRAAQHLPPCALTRIDT